MRNTLNSYHFFRWIPSSVSELAIAATKDWFGNIETVSVDQVRNLPLNDFRHLKWAGERAYEAWMKGSD